MEYFEYCSLSIIYFIKEVVVDHPIVSSLILIFIIIYCIFEKKF